MADLNLKQQIHEFLTQMSKKIDSFQGSMYDIIEIANFESIPKEVSNLLALYCKNIQKKVNDYGPIEDNHFTVFQGVKKMADSTTDEGTLSSQTKKMDNQ